MKPCELSSWCQPSRSSGTRPKHRRATRACSRFVSPPVDQDDCVCVCLCFFLSWRQRYKAARRQAAGLNHWLCLHMLQVDDLHQPTFSAAARVCRCRAEAWRSGLNSERKKSGNDISSSRVLCCRRSEGMCKEVRSLQRLSFFPPSFSPGNGLQKGNICCILKTPFFCFLQCK